MRALGGRVKRSAIACLFALLVWLPDAFAQTTPVGTVKTVAGGAQATRGGNVVPLRLNDGVFRNDVLETSAGAKLDIVFRDGTNMSLGPDAEVVIDDFVFQEAGAQDNVALRLASGAARFISGQIAHAAQANMSVRTPVATIGIRGTDFFTEMDGRHLSAALFSGYEITVSNASGTTVLRPGEGADVWGDEAPTHRQNWGPARINRALALVNTGAPYLYSRPLAVASTLGEALTAGHIKANARYRYEYADQANRPQTAYAHTLRARLGYETLAWNGFFAGVEGQIVRDVGARRGDGLVNPPSLPVIPDPDTSRLNQAYGGWTTTGSDGSAGTRVVIGRQRLSYDNERWVGSIEFRQTDQVFDAASFETRALPGFAVRYAYTSRVNRVLGDNPNGVWSSKTHLVNVGTTLVPFGVTTAYAYLLDLRPVPTLSSATTGIRYDGGIDAGALRIGLEAEIARQRDYGRNPNAFGLTYALIRPSLKFSRTTLYAGWESLGSDGRISLQTPLSTLHAQNGWADIFNTTPVNGLHDTKLRIVQDLPDVGPLKNGKLDLRWHDFKAARGGVHYGHEWDADINASVNGWITAGVQFARYEADRFASDTTKVFAYIEFQY